MKVQISLDDDLVQRIDSYADSVYMSRSGMITQACVQYLNQNELVASLHRISLACEKVASSGQVDEETMKQLDEFQRLVRMFVQSK